MINSNLELKIELDIADAKNNYSDLANVIRLLIYKQSPELYRAYEDKEDDFFMNPLFFAFFNNTTIEKNSENLEEVLKNNYKFKKCKNHNFALLEEIPSFLQEYFFEFYRGTITNPNPDFSLTPSYFPLVEDALDTIKKYLPHYYEELLLSNKFLILHNNNKIINFVSKKTSGLLYFSTVPGMSQVHFIEEFVHQGIHNYFNLFLHDKRDHFIGNPREIAMSVFNNNKEDYRSFMSAFHGLLTVAKRLELFRKLLVQEIFEGKEKHELVGRYADQLVRFSGLGIHKLDLSKACTQKGIDLFNTVYQTAQRYLELDGYLMEEFDLSFRDIDFYYSDFEKHNPFATFELTKTYNFNKL